MMPLYVYALTGSRSAPFAAGGHRIEFIDVGGVFAAVAPMRATPELSEATLRAQHDAIAEIAARVDAILPARFGSLVDLGELERVVTLRHDAIGEALALVAGCEQMTVRVFGEVEAADVRPAAPPTTGTEYLRQRAEAEKWMPDLLRPLADAVRPLVKAERVVRGERGVAATVYHLVARGVFREYQAALEPLRANFPGPGFIISGPWAPFAFAPELWS